MSKQWPGGLIRKTPPTVNGSVASGVWTLDQAASYRKLGLWPTLPGAPTIGTATAGNATATVPFTAPTDTGSAAITSYIATSSPGSITGTAASSPITVSGLTNDTTYTFVVQAINGAGTGPASAASNGVTPVAPPYGVFGGGNTLISNIDYVTISTTGNATNWGYLTTSTGYNAACASTTRGVFGGGTLSGGARSNVMAYITFASTGNAVSFGTLLEQQETNSACNSSTRGIFAGGSTPSASTNAITYITIATTGNATTFGILSYGTNNFLASTSSPTRGVFAGGSVSSSESNAIDYITIATTGNSTTFGQLTQRRSALGGCSSGTRAVFGGGYSPTVPGNSNVLDYITIASTGNATTFGTLTASQGVTSCSSSTRGLFNTGAGIVYITIASTGNATTFGNLTTNRANAAACSNVNGGVQ